MDTMDSNTLDMNTFDADTLDLNSLNTVTMDSNTLDMNTFDAIYSLNTVTTDSDTPDTSILDANRLDPRHNLNTANLPFHFDNPMLDSTASNEQSVAALALTDTTGLETPARDASAIPFRIETKRVYICAYQNCNKKYGRLPELRRHQRGAHLNDQRWKCRSAGCDRTTRGFPRRDKRDDHERKVHQWHGVA